MNRDLRTSSAASMAVKTLLNEPDDLEDDYGELIDLQDDGRVGFKGLFLPTAQPYFWFVPLG